MSNATATKRKPNTADLLTDLNSYDKVIVSFSGGKDSLACLLDLLERGVDKSRIELWHQDVDGETDSFMDWPITKAYCQAVGDALGVPVRFQWKEGGFRGEMLRNNSRTAGVAFTTDDGTQHLEASTQAKPQTRRKFPQVAADLRVRWCSAYLKIDVAARAMTNDPRFKEASVLFVTGERAEESAGRAKYPIVERHRTCTKRRTVHQYRPVADWTEQQVWDIIERWKIEAHPCYHLGFGRCSCMACIFGNKDQWATVRHLSPKRFSEIADYETEFGCTIHRTKSVSELADSGMVYFATAAKTRMKQIAMGKYFPAKWIINESWTLPSGAFQECGGPN